MKKRCNEKLTYYLSWLTVVVIVILLILEINVVFNMFEMTQAGFILYVVYYAAALFIPLVLLSSILAFKFKEKRSIKLLVNIGITYAVVKIILVIISSIKLFNAGVF